MQLDMQTMSAVNVAVTAVLGGVLLLTWLREQESPFVGWWGLALLLQAAGVAAAAVASPVNANELVAIGTASIILGDALKWKASREFTHRRGYFGSCSVRLASCSRCEWVISNPSTSASIPSAPSLLFTTSRRRWRWRPPAASNFSRAGLPLSCS